MGCREMAQFCTGLIGENDGMFGVNLLEWEMWILWTQCWGKLIFQSNENGGEKVSSFFIVILYFLHITVRKTSVL